MNKLYIEYKQIQQCYIVDVMHYIVGTIDKY